MSNVIQFLEAMGKDAALTRLSGPEYVEAIAKLELDHELRDALARKDVSAVKRLLGTSETLMMMLFRKEEDAPQEDEREDDEPPSKESSLLISAANG